VRPGVKLKTGDTTSSPTRLRRFILTRLYVGAGKRLVVSGAADATFGLFAAAIGYLVDA
jgi:hypothetical protein